MKRIIPFAALICAACVQQNNNTQSMIETHPQVVAQVLDSLKQRHAELDETRAAKGLEQAATLWRSNDGSEADFVQLCLAEYVHSEAERQAMCENFSAKLETIFGHFNAVTLELNVPLNEQGEEPTKVDLDMASFDAGAHFTDDLFASKVAFAVVVNFPSYSLREKQQLGDTWTPLQWAYARLGDVFATRVPAAVRQAVAQANTDAEAYISRYNIAMGGLRTDSGEQLFPSDLLLNSHWGLRDELKANYADTQRGLEKQRTIVAVMHHIVEQDIPEAVIGNPQLQWNPSSNKVYDESGSEASAAPEPDTRYKIFLANFAAQQKVDTYTPQMPTYIQRAFERDMEMTVDDIKTMYLRFVSSPQVAKVAELISARLGRPLEPFDVWYDGFKTRSGISEDELSAQTRRLYPNAEAFERGLPQLLQRLGFSPAEAQRICSKVEVDAARGSGHAWGAQMRSDKAHLRTRIQPSGMDYKGYNIAVHEFGHNVEQTISLHDVPHYVMSGVPNTACTEALAFVFQGRDLQLLGIADKGSNREHLAALDVFWSCYEIMGVSLVDIGVWEWLYAHPTATPAELKEAVLRIAREVWNAYYAPVLGSPDSPLLAIYSHMVNTPLYLSNYPLGHLVDFQLEEQFRGRNFADEILRIFSLGRLTPQLWMKRATGREVGVEALLEAAERGVSVKF
jgi:hypothetical protein